MRQPTTWWLLAALALACAMPQAWADERSVEPNTLVPLGDPRHAASAFPDRIVAVPLQDGGRGFAVSWRTGPDVEAPVLEIAPAQDSPDPWLGGLPPRRVVAGTRVAAGRHGTAHHHHARVDALEPGTLYAWRVQGAGTWSPWRQLRTAPPEGEPLELLYFGDTQNQNASLVTRVMHEALRHAPRAQLALFAGDLVSEAVDDDEWGEWFEATAGLAPLMGFAPAPGNHEFFKAFEDTPRERRVLGAPWQLHFALPGNGAEGHRASSYWFDYQQVRIAVLDGTSVLDLDTGPAQAAWLDTVLRDSPKRWHIVLVHQPFHSPRADRDNQALRRHLQPVIERHGVDLVLQGHDHVYGRRSAAGRATPVYAVSVAGPKQYRLSAQARGTMAPVGEDMQLFQVLRLDGGRLSYEARTVTGQLYDAFDLVDGGAAGKRLVERTAGRLSERRCARAATLKGRSDRCWE